VGSGGTATGLEQAGFTAAALVEIDAKCCGTLRANWPDWQVFEGSIERIDGTKVAGQVDLLSAGPPCRTSLRSSSMLRLFVSFVPSCGDLPDGLTRP
jgi:site-specific DNA-cytosine methylase